MVLEVFSNLSDAMISHGVHGYTSGFAVLEVIIKFQRPLSLQSAANDGPKMLSEWYVVVLDGSQILKSL